MKPALHDNDTPDAIADAFQAGASMEALSKEWGLPTSVIEHTIRVIFKERLEAKN